MAKRANDDNQSARERLQALKREQEELEKQIREDLTSQLDDIITQMDELGVKLPSSLVQRVLDENPAQRRLSEASGTQKAEKARKREAVPGTPCKICGFATEPYHDARLKAHRDQGDKKKPLTADELTRNNLKRLTGSGDPRHIKKGQDAEASGGSSVGNG